MLPMNDFKLKYYIILNKHQTYFTRIILKTFHLFLKIEGNIWYLLMHCGNVLGMNHSVGIL